MTDFGSVISRESGESEAASAVIENMSSSASRAEFHQASPEQQNRAIIGRGHAEVNVARAHL